MDPVLGAVVEMMQAAGTRTIECAGFSHDYVACAPAFGPHAEAPVTPVYEDGSRLYEGNIVWDGDDMVWRHSPLVLNRQV